jgi:D-alanyl-D-alanine dipeptidase
MTYSLLAAPAQSGATAGGAFVSLRGMPGVTLDLRYASTNNLLGADLYGGFDGARLHRIAAAKLEKAAQLLQARHPGWTIVVFDALRPRSVQRRFWEKVRGTPMEYYFANPAGGSVHNFGLAVDASLRDEAGREVDMGTGFDALEPLAQPALEARFHKEGKLSDAQLANRKLLRSVMRGAGFHTIRKEWWHFDALPHAEVRAKFRIVE